MKETGPLYQDLLLFQAPLHFFFTRGLFQPAVLSSRNLSVFWETVVSY